MKDNWVFEGKRWVSQWRGIAGMCRTLKGREGERLKGERERDGDSSGALSVVQKARQVRAEHCMRVKSNRTRKKYCVQAYTRWPFVGGGKRVRRVLVPFSITPIDASFHDERQEEQRRSKIVLTGCVWLSVFFISEWSHFQQIKRRRWFCSITCTRREKKREI